ncbi:MAG: D-2-hydroxyacid dehydrogenase [Pseudomonadota bacterium]
MTRIVALDRGTIGPSVTLTKPAFVHDWVEYDRTRPDQVVERLAGAEIAVSNKVPIRRAEIEQLPDLKAIVIPATGYDAFDIAACKERGITVSNVRGYAVTTVPEHTFSLIFALRRGIVGFRQDVIDGKWQEADQFCFFTHPIRDLARSTIGIIGEGSIGQGVATIARALGMTVLFAAHKGVNGLGPLYTPFDEVLERADIITLHCPLLPATRDLIAMPEFRQMKRQPLIVNCSRGGLVNEADLVSALNEGLIAGAGFDCLTSEPPAPDNPLLTVLDRPNVIVTPHVAWASDEAMQTLWDQVVTHIENFHAGTPSNVVG